MSRVYHLESPARASARPEVKRVMADVAGARVEAPILSRLARLTRNTNGLEFAEFFRE